LQYELAHFKGNMGHDATSDVLYYARAVDSTAILPSLSSLTTEQAKPTALTKATVM
jgi:hypothetical protein